MSRVGTAVRVRDALQKTCAKPQVSLAFGSGSAYQSDTRLNFMMDRCQCATSIFLAIFNPRRGRNPALCASIQRPRGYLARGVLKSLNLPELAWRRSAWANPRRLISDAASGGLHSSGDILSEALVVNVGDRAVPTEDLAVLVALGRTKGEHPAIFAGAVAEPILCLEPRAALQ